MYISLIVEIYMVGAYYALRTQYIHTHFGEGECLLHGGHLLHNGCLCGTFAGHAKVVTYTYTDGVQMYRKVYCLLHLHKGSRVSST